jgi:hypothetical protein
MTIVKQSPILAGLFSSTLKMEAIYYSETSVGSYRTTWHQNPEDRIDHNHRCGNINPSTNKLIGLEVLTPVLMKSTVFWKVNLRFGGKYCHHLQGRRLTLERNQHERRWQAEPLGSGYSSTLKTEAICSSGTSVDFQRSTSIISEKIVPFMNKLVSQRSGRPRFPFHDLWFIKFTDSLTSYAVLFLASQGSGRKKLNKDEVKYGEPLIWYKDLASHLFRVPAGFS